MIISLAENSKKYSNVVFHVIRIFVPTLTWEQLINESIEDTHLLEIKLQDNLLIIKLDNGLNIQKEISDCDEHEIKRLIKVGVYQLLQAFMDNEGSPWGILTGIRPTKLVNSLWEKGLTEKEIEKILANDFLISDDKISKLLNITKYQRSFVDNNSLDKKVSIYISIPFCPTKCYYCSFPSYSLSKWRTKIDEYVKNLCFEIKEVGKALSLKNIDVETIYIGGGTPTVLNVKQLKILLDTINKYIYTNGTVEFTVEAGRPDTLNEDKFLLLKESRVNRISINPQTMVDKTLKRIGRNHTSEDIIDKVQMAQKIGLENINMDLILGLPGEDIDSLSYSLEKIKSLNPESITVHVLSLKRSASYDMNLLSSVNSTIVEEMSKFTEKFMEKSGYIPYYLYRQKQMVANLENVGYSLNDSPCIYNIQMIEEKQTIWGLGVGSTSKIVNNATKSLANKYNPKDLFLYNDQIKEITQKKVDKILTSS